MVTTVEESFDGQTLKQALKSAEDLLEEKIEEINALNVFPVPDGDTGINMYLTLQSANQAVESLSSTSAAEISAKVARGALLGARGNSGVILSQILRGLAKGLEMKECLSTSDLARALRHASDTAAKAVTQPVEGTIITVMREASRAATRAEERGASLKQAMTAIVSQARRTVEKTPELLPQLKEAGVVDAGGKGLFYIFLGWKSCIHRKMVRERLKAASRRAGVSGDGAGYGVEVQCLVSGDGLPLEDMREKINGLGESAIVVGDEHLVRVHVHTWQPQAVLDYCAGLGSLMDVSQDDMDKQVRDFRAARSKARNKNRR